MPSDFDNKLRLALEEVDLESWLSDYVGVKRAGKPSMRSLEVCPECGNSNYKLYVNLDSKIWFCQVCEWGRGRWNAVELMTAISGRSEFEIYREIFQFVRPAPAADFVDKLQAAFAPKEVQTARPLEIAQIPGVPSFTGITASKVQNYLLSRGVTDEEISKYQLRTVMSLFRFNGPFVVFPVLYKGVPVSWQGRRAGKQEPKYVSAETIGDWLWPIDIFFCDVIVQKGYVVLVEGVFDALGLWRIGVPALCTFGKKITDRQIDLLSQLHVKAVIFMWDADATRTSTRKQAHGGSKSLRGEVEQSAIRLKSKFVVRVADLANPPIIAGLDKVDPGEVLRHPELSEWLGGCLTKSMDVNSTEFFQWRLG